MSSFRKYLKLIENSLFWLFKLQFSIISKADWKPKTDECMFHTREGKELLPLLRPGSFFQTKVLFVGYSSPKKTILIKYFPTNSEAYFISFEKKYHISFGSFLKRWSNILSKIWEFTINFSSLDYKNYASHLDYIVHFSAILIKSLFPQLWWLMRWRKSMICSYRKHGN